MFLGGRRGQLGLYQVLEFLVVHLPGLGKDQIVLVLDDVLEQVYHRVQIQNAHF